MPAACAACGRELLPTSRFCAGCGTPVGSAAATPAGVEVAPPAYPPPPPPAAPSYAQPVAPGPVGGYPAQFPPAQRGQASQPGQYQVPAAPPAPVAPPAAVATKSTPGISLRGALGWVVMSGFALVALGALLPWAQLDTKSFYPMWGDGKRFWVGDQVDADVVDGLLMLLLGLGGVLLVWLERSNPGAEALYRVGWVADVVAIFALWIAELRFIVKIDGVGIGLGPIVILLGVLVALAPALVPYIFRRLLYSDDR